MYSTAIQIRAVLWHVP